MRPIYIFDLDGTLALCDHRLHHIQKPVCAACEGEASIARNPVSGGCCINCGDTGEDPTFKPNWGAFFAACVHDEPNWPVIRTLQALRRGGAEIWIWTGRSDEVEEETKTWLRHYGVLPRFRLSIPVPEEFIMRTAGDHRNDDDLKRGWLSEVEPPEYERIAGVFEDRSRVVQMWRNAGIPCFQVAKGDF